MERPHGARGLARWWVLPALLGVLLLPGCGGARRLLMLPGTEACSKVTVAAARLHPPQPVQIVHNLPSSPFAVTATARWAFVSYPDSHRPDFGLISVLALRGSTARLVRTVTVPGEPFGEALARAGRFLLVASYASGLEILSTDALETGTGRTVVAQVPSRGQGSMLVVVSAGGRYAFVTEEESADVAVYDLGGLRPGALRRGATAPREVGSVPVGKAPAGITLSPDGAVLYVISQETRGAREGAPGELSAINVREAERDPARARTQSILAGCDPVRVALSASGTIAWVTDRGGNSVLAFRLGTPGSRTFGRLAAAVRVGSEPVGVALVDSGAVALVTNSARFSDPTAPQSIAVIDTAEALAHGPSLLGALSAGAFPRNFGQAPGGPVLFTDFNSDDVRVISTADLRWLGTLSRPPR
jgi:DNA-binding beta-propeller fold protein YncE